MPLAIWRVGPVVLVLALFVPALAYASAPTLQPGVHVDPGSPTGKEYAIPLGSARGGTPGGTGSTKLFGSGITTTNGSPPTGTAPASKAPHPRRHHHARGGSHSKHRKSAVRQRVDPIKAPAPATVLDSGSGGGAGIAWMLGAAALVLAVGGLGAFAAGRRGRRTSPGAG